MSDIHINSFKSVKLDIFSETHAYLSSATGYFISHNRKFYLVSNLHVVSGKNPQTGKNLRADCAIPGSITVHIQATTNKTESTIEYIKKTISIPLYKKSTITSCEYDIHSPLWLSESNSKIDIALIDITHKLDEIYPHNIEVFDLAREIEKTEIDLGVMDEVFIVGFPLDTKTTPNCFPIYKGATIASEPLQYADLPIFYIDGKTKKGMSGSPVIKKHKFDLKISNGKITGTKDRIDLIGTYSGRDTTAEDEYTAELGIVWHVNKTLLKIIEQQNPASDSNSPKPALAT